MRSWNLAGWRDAMASLTRKSINASKDHGRQAEKKNKNGEQELNKEGEQATPAGGDPTLDAQV